MDAGEFVGVVFLFSALRYCPPLVVRPTPPAHASNAAATQGVGVFLTILALLSLSLSLLNLRPIPLLYVGHLLYYLSDLFKGSPLSELSMAAGQYVGLALLAGLMGLA